MTFKQKKSVKSRTVGDIQSVFSAAVTFNENTEEDAPALWQMAVM